MLKLLAGIIAIISTITLQAQTPQQGSLSGTLIDKNTLRPIMGAGVLLNPCNK